MGKHSSIIVVGPSGSGKTLLVSGLKNPELQEKVYIPQRFATRPKRQDDLSGENSFIDEMAFEAGVKDGLIDPYWRRRLNGVQAFSYGFEPGDSHDDRLRIYSANNDFVRDKNPSVERVLDSGLVVFVMADQEARDYRLSGISADFSEAERMARLDDDGADVLETGLPMERIDTTNITPQEGQTALRGIVDSVVK